MTRILLADDHQMVLDGVQRVLDEVPGMEVVGQAKDGQSLLSLAGRLAPDAVVMETCLPGLTGLEAVRQLREECPAPRIVVLSMHENLTTALSLLRAGAWGYVTKRSPTSELLRAMHLALQDQNHLSPDLLSRLVRGILSGGMFETDRLLSFLTVREQEVLVLMAEGYKVNRIAGQLGITPKTVDTHRIRIMKKLGIDSLAGLVKYALREGLVTF